MPGVGLAPVPALNPSSVMMPAAAQPMLLGACPAPGMQAMLLQQQMFQQMMQCQQQQVMQQQTTSQLTLQAAKAYEDSVQQSVDHDVKELAHHFKLDDRITKDLDVQLKKRRESFDDDIKALWGILEGARNPAGLLRIKLREMEEGTFRGSAAPDNEIEEMARKFNLDSQAIAKLSEVLGRRDDRKKDLKQIQKHLELSNKPSSLVMLMLKDLRAGLPVKDPEHPAAVGSYAHKRGLKRGGGRSRSRDRDRDRERERRTADSSSSSPPRGAARPTISRSSGAGPLPNQAAPAGSGSARPMTLLERFG